MNHRTRLIYTIAACTCVLLFLVLATYTVIKTLLKQ